MNRRAFLSRIVKSTAAVAIALSVPTQTILAWTPQTYRGDLALQFMRQEVNKFYSEHHQMPDSIIAGPSLYNHTEDQMTEAVKGSFMGMVYSPRHPFPNFMFKGIAFVKTPRMQPWDYALIEKTSVGFVGRNKTYSEG